MFCMESIKNIILVVVILVALCDFIGATGVCKFANIFPSTANENRSNGTQKSEEMRTDSGVQLCPQNMTYSNNSCQPTCEDPLNYDGCSNSSTNESCVCLQGYLMHEGSCIRQEECGCFVQGKGVIKDGEVYVNPNCSLNCSCNANRLLCQDIQCSVNATCRTIEGAHQCVCKEGFGGDGQTCVVVVDCLDLYNAGVQSNGVYIITPTGWTGSAFEVYCEMESDGGGWTVLQKRLNGSVDFYRNWTSYKDGFGNLTHEFWLGNDKIHTLTSQGKYQLRIEAVNLNNPLPIEVYGLYTSFSISDENDSYRLNIGTHSGNTAEDPLQHSNGQPFSTYDQDNDGTDMCHCSVKLHGAWWYSYRTVATSSYSSACWKWVEGEIYGYCGDSNLNGGYHENKEQSIFFGYIETRNIPHCGFTESKMKIRRG